MVIPFRFLLVTFMTLCTLVGCGGSNEPYNHSRQASPSRLSQRTQLLTLPGMRAGYRIDKVGGGYTITDLAGTAAPLQVNANTRVRFADVTLAFDVEGSAGKAYRLYQAAFNRTPDAAGLSFWIRTLDAGSDMEAIANGFVNSDEFKQLYGSNPANTDIVNKLYQNILHRNGDPGGVAFWLDILNNRKASLAQVLIGFSESTENKQGLQAVTGLGIGVFEAGIDYAPVAVAGANRTALLTDLVTLDGSASTPGGNAVSYQWTMTAKPANSSAVILLSTTARPNFIVDLPGMYELSLVVSNGKTTSAPARVSIRGSTQADASTIAPTQNYVYLQSSTDEFVGGGRNYLFTQRDSTFNVSAANDHFRIYGDGEFLWRGDFSIGNAHTQLVPGVYDFARRYPFNTPANVGLYWVQAGNECNEVTGSFTIDKVTWVNNVITAIDLHFEQYCDISTTPLRGRIHWNVADTTSPPGPVNPAPSWLWKPPVGSTPGSGNYVYLDSDRDDFIGKGKRYLYTPTEATLSATVTDNTISVWVMGNQVWSGKFKGMNFQGTPTPGYYGNLKRYPFNNPVKGGVDWSGTGGGCTVLGGWFVIDNITFDDSTLTALDVRFEQHCENESPALHGQIHWRISDTTKPPGPLNPVPAGLWRPGIALPASGNYAYFESSEFDFVGQGKKTLYSANTPFWVRTTPSYERGFGYVSIQFADWRGEFETMSVLNTLQPGYYSDLQRYPFNNKNKGGLIWSEFDRGCSVLSGWVAIDKVSYVGTSLSALDMRFEQICGDSPQSPLHGIIHWTAPVAAK